MADPAPTEGDAPGTDARVGGFGSLGSILLLLGLTWSAGIASLPLNDNSFFTHLATGRIILAERSVPSVDPYTFTALGEPWTVQSWLASVAYASAEALGSGVGLRVLVLAVFVVAMVVLWRLSAAATSVISRLLLVSGALVVFTDLWSARPYMVGVIGLGCLWLALDGTWSPIWLVPLGWIWANTHGSYLLGVGLVVCVAAGRALDARAATGRFALAGRDRAVGIGLGAGIVLGCIGPLGTRVLSFPLTALDKAGVFAEILEWQAPRFVSVSERAFLVVLVVTILALVHLRRWTFTVPAVVFIAAALVAQRNIVMATVVLVPILAAAAPQWGTLRVADRPAVGRVAAGFLVVVVALVGAVAVSARVTTLGGYPTRAVALVGPLADTDPRLAGELITGNLLEVLDGPTGAVFADDRVDMLPEDVVDDVLALGRGRLGWEQILDRHRIERVVWARSSPLASLLAASPAWRVELQDAGWVLACRRGGPGCAPAG